MDKKRIVFYETEPEYLRNFTTFLWKRKDLPFRLDAYSDMTLLLEEGREKGMEALLISEDEYCDEIRELKIPRVFLLTQGNPEPKDLSDENIVCINKYQQAARILQEILEHGDDLWERHPMAVPTEKTGIIGFYSPIHRCLQTSFAITLGQILGKDAKVLYLSFEHYAGWNQLLDTNIRGDLTALLYFSKEQREKFLCHLQALTMQIGNMFYIPPAYSGKNLLCVCVKDWVNLLSLIAQESSYDYLILDLSDCVQGTFEILGMCDRIFTIVKEDDVSRGKISQYEQLLRESDCMDVLEKTEKQSLPTFEKIPSAIEQYTCGELADFVRELLKKNPLEKRHLQGERYE